jgi:hypothetical protein
MMMYRFSFREAAAKEAAKERYAKLHAAGKVRHTYRIRLYRELYSLPLAITTDG